MTVSNTTRLVEKAGASPSWTEASFGFKIFSSDELIVTLIVDATGVQTVQTISTHYTIDGVGADAGGTVTMISAPAVGETLRIERVVPYTQLTKLRTQGEFRPEAVEEALDRLAMGLAQMDGVDAATEYASADAPTPSSAYSGVYIIVRDTGVPAQLKYCLEKATDDTYSWVTVATGEF